MRYWLRYYEKSRLGVFFEVGFKGHFWLNIILTLFGFIPGIIHAFYVILKH
ncbi:MULTISPECIES: YqaE/Pmp3 family membrane protein [unclassified Halomonas]|uniref:YqaE/Pmp3 family membrane protein n=1 Tax=unclassified Halomonas TaxID=2609666 RepID=UPI0018667E79|nr:MULTISPECIES: YqaE/Pmp3 family membrane protein [unclassified Halomonas]